MSKWLPCLAALVVAFGTSVSIHAAILTSGIVPIPSPNPGSPIDHILPVLNTVPGGFTGTWSAPAQANWVGTFTATGPIPSGTNNPAGTTVYRFPGLPFRALPAGSIILIGDLDSGSGAEQITISGACEPCALSSPLFLNEPLGVTDTTSDFIPALAEMPSVTVMEGIFNTTFLFDGSAVAGDPGILFAMETNWPLTILTVVRSSPNTSLWILAPPVPEPTTGVLLGMGVLCLLRRR